MCRSLLYVTPVSEGIQAEFIGQEQKLDSSESPVLTPVSRHGPFMHLPGTLELKEIYHKSYLVQRPHFSKINKVNWESNGFHICFWAETRHWSCWVSVFFLCCHQRKTDKYTGQFMRYKCLKLLAAVWVWNTENTMSKGIVFYLEILLDSSR